MNIRVLFFAQLRDAMGAEERSVEAADGATARQVVADVLSDSRLKKFSALPMRYAVNEEFIDPAMKLHDRDTLALIPPVAGG